MYVSKCGFRPRLLIRLLHMGIVEHVEHAAHVLCRLHFRSLESFSLICAHTHNSVLLLSFAVRKWNTFLLVRVI